VPYIRDVPGKGRGVFAEKYFAKDEIIERPPVVVLPDPDWKLIEQTALRDYYLYWDENSTVVPAGYVMFYNHSDDPNAKVIRRLDERVVEVVALRRIARDEEVTVKYRCQPWFEVLP
jgi:uncharacterized protein